MCYAFNFLLLFMSIVCLQFQKYTEESDIKDADTNVAEKLQKLNCCRNNTVGLEAT